MNSQSGELFLTHLRGRIEKSTCSSLELLSLGNRRTMERLARGLKIPDMLKYVTMLFPVSGLFPKLAKTRRFLVLFRGLHFPICHSSRMQASWIAKLTEFRVDVVSHSILVLLAKSKSSVQLINKHS